MAIKFEKIQPGMVLYDVHWERAGNTMMRRLGVWTVRIISIDDVRRSAVVSWNGNVADTWHQRSLQKLYVKPTPGHEATLELQRRRW